MNSAASPDASLGPVAERALLFTLGGELFGLRLAVVDGLGEPVPVSPVPGAPSVVLGLIEWRGRVLTLLDLPRLVDRPAENDDAICIIRLAPPLERTALRVPGAVHLGWVSSDTASPQAEPLHALHAHASPSAETQSPSMVEPGALIRMLASELES